ncbi:MAG: heptaprenyl diphosphate synthase component 1 [Lysinibacillus sp.]|nr:heptaprenyl diphosphate synthase component 1 [Lysinibacillus sp.]
MDASYIEKHIEQLKMDIYRHVQHKTLLKYTGNPLVNENQLFYMLLPFFNGENWDEEKYEGIITVGIVQASLSEHGLIDESEATSKTQQLTVLSGDYYSGRYYEILANSGNIPLIRQLSEGVVLRSEHEIRVYEPNNYTFDDWLQSLTIIESEFISRFYQQYNFEQYRAIMETNLLALRLQQELANYKEGNSSLFFLKMMDSFVPEDSLNFEKFMEDKVEKLIHQLLELLHTSLLKEELQLYIDKQLIRQS